MKKFILLLVCSLSLVGCTTTADTVSRNLSKDADEFKVLRRIVFYNGITGDYILSMEGYCSLGNYDDYGELTVTCKTGVDQFKKHFLGLSDNVTYFAEQIEGKDVNEYQYKVIFRPRTIIPDIEVK